MSQKPVRPFLITKDTGGAFRLTVRDTKYNSQDYPFIVPELQDEEFSSLAQAKAFAKQKYNAQPREIAVE